MTQLLQEGAVLCTVLGALSVVAIGRSRNLRLTLGVLLDFLLAAGLLRLGAARTWSALATAAAIVMIRKLATFGLARSAGRRSQLPSEIRNVQRMARAPGDTAL